MIQLLCFCYYAVSVIFFSVNKCRTSQVTTAEAIAYCIHLQAMVLVLLTFKPAFFGKQ